MRLACAGCVASIGTGLIPRAARGERKSRQGEQRPRSATRASVTSATAEHTERQSAWARCRSTLSAIAGCGGAFWLAFAVDRFGLTGELRLIAVMAAILVVPLLSPENLWGPAVAAGAAGIGLRVAAGTLPSVDTQVALAVVAVLASAGAAARVARERRVREQVAVLEQRGAELAEANAAQHEASEIAAAVLAVTRDVPASLDAREVTAQVARNVCTATQSAASAVLLWDAEHELFRVAAVAGSGEGPDVQQLEVSARAAAALRGALGEGMADIPRAALADSVLDVLMHRWNASAVLAARLQRGDRLLGLLIAARRSAAPASAKACRILSGIAVQAAAVLESANLVNELRTANTLREEFTATMSHELRTPLNVIIGYNDLQRDGAFGDLSPEHMDTLNRVHEQAVQLLDLIQATLDVGRLERGLMTVDLHEVKVHDVLKQLFASLPRAWRKSTVELRWRVDPTVPGMRTDRTKLHVILRNLVHNALKFTEAGLVTVTATADGDGQRVHFVVQDSGAGIAAQDLSVIFEMFRQASGRDPAISGAGLGLYIVKRLVTLLGGEIDVLSAPGRGASFRVHLPTGGPHVAPLRGNPPTGHRPLRAAMRAHTS